jgi:hypothetical protein
MCGRYSRAKQGLDYVVPLMPDAVSPESDLFRPSWNVAPRHAPARDLSERPARRAMGISARLGG